MKAAGGLLLGLLLGYLAAWVLPRRRPVREGAYEAPVPERIDLPSRHRPDAVGGSPRDSAAPRPDLAWPQPEACRVTRW